MLQRVHHCHLLTHRERALCGVSASEWTACDVNPSLTWAAWLGEHRMVSTTVPLLDLPLFQPFKTCRLPSLYPQMAVNTNPLDLVTTQHVNARAHWW